MEKGPLLVSLVVFSAVAGGSFAYGWHSITHIPNQSTTAVAPPVTETNDTSPTLVNQPPTSPETNFSDTASPRPSITEQLSTLTGEEGRIILTLDEPQLNQLIADAVFSQAQAAQILANASSLTTELKGDLIETGTVLNLSEIPLEGLPTDWQASLTQVTAAIPVLANRDIYIGIIAQPQIQDGKIRLGEDLSLKFGQFTLPMTDVAGQLGLSMTDMEQRLNALLAERGIVLDTIDISDNQLIITGESP